VGEGFVGATAPRGSWSRGGEATGKQSEDGSVRASRWQPEADTSGALDHAGSSRNRSVVNSAVLQEECLGAAARSVWSSQ
jgi:hypothetical protein